MREKIASFRLQQAIQGSKLYDIHPTRNGHKLLRRLPGGRACTVEYDRHVAVGQRAGGIRWLALAEEVGEGLKPARTANLFIQPSRRF